MTPLLSDSGEPMRVLALVEHVDRELDLICLLKLLLRDEFGIELEVANFYADAPLLLNGPAPHVLLTPFFYGADDLVMRDYVAAWPRTRLVNLAWEQVFYPSHASIKAPRDEWARDKVTHLAWSQTFVDYLSSHGAQPGNIRLVGHSLYRLYRAPYRDYFASRRQLAQEFGLDESVPWLFVPENYRWAFFSDNKLKKLGKRGVELDDLMAMRDYCRAALRKLVLWCQSLASSGGMEVIFRPRPATSVKEISEFVAELLDGAAPSFRLIKGRTARDWTLASDVVASSYSTVLIEAAIAGKALVKVDPLAVPRSLRYDWCDLVPGVATSKGFAAACRARDPASGADLRAWAERAFLLDHDPVHLLARTVGETVEGARSVKPATSPDHSMQMSAELAARARATPAMARHELFEAEVEGYFFSPATHEKDLFAAADVDARVEAWARLAGLQTAQSSTP